MTLRPFYSIADLADHREEDPVIVRDALVAAGVPMIHDGKEADLSSWQQHPYRNANGQLVIIQGFTLSPDPERVVVSSARLPSEWLGSLMRNEVGDSGAAGGKAAVARWDRLGEVKRWVSEQRLANPGGSRARFVATVLPEVRERAKNAGEPLSGADRSVTNTVNGWLRKAGIK